MVQLDEGRCILDAMDPSEPANGSFSSGGGYCATQLYLLLSAAEIQRRHGERGD